MHPGHLMGNGCPGKVHMREAGTRFFVGFADAIRHRPRLANANSDAAFVVAHHDYRAESETPTPFDYFCHTANIDDALIQFFALFFTPFASFICHRLLTPPHGKMQTNLHDSQLGAAHLAPTADGYI